MLKRISAPHAKPLARLRRLQRGLKRDRPLPAGGRRNARRHRTALAASLAGRLAKPDDQVIGGPTAKTVDRKRLRIFRRAT
jgi:hypothetical protein